MGGTRKLINYADGQVLSLKHKMFVDEWFRNGGDTTRAYLAVYEGDISVKSANTSGNKILVRGDVKAYIAEYEARRSNHLQITTNITREDMVNELNKILQSPKTADANKLKAIEQICKLLGLNEVEKHQMVHSMEQPLFAPLTPSNQIPTSDPLTIDITPKEEESNSLFDDDFDDSLPFD